MMKQLAIEYEEALEIIGNLEDLINKAEIKDEHIRYRYRYKRYLKEIKTQLVECQSVNNISAPAIVKSHLNEFVSLLSDGQNFSESPYLLARLMVCSSQLNSQLASKQTILNSKTFYETEIKELKQNISKLKDDLSKYNAESEESRKLLQEKELILEQQNAKLVALENDKDELERREDARQDWHTKISSAFETLGEGLKPIEAEKTRLNILYFVYCILCVALIAFLVVVEMAIYCKLSNFYGIPQFKDYMALIAPLPIALALLFVFLSQINRAQRQLVAISKYIHDIKYTEEIMLAINSLSVDIDDSMKRINTAMDRLLDRHLSCNLNFLDETSLHEQENKDENVVPVNQVADILKRVIENNN